DCGDFSGWLTRSHRGFSLYRIRTRDVALERLDGVFLAADHPLHHIADGDDAHHPVAIDHGQVAEVALGHHIHAIVHGVLRCYGDHRTGHDFADRSFLRGVSLKNSLARIVALREDAYQLLPRHHHQGADVVFGHERQGVVHGLLRRNG